MKILEGTRPGFYVVLAAIIMAGVLISKQATVNFNHNPKIQVKHPSTIDCDFFAKTCDIQLTTEIGMPEEYYHIGKELRSINENYTIRLHLSGFGGAIKGMNYIKSVIDQTGAKTVSIVEGDVYSAHAYLSTAFDEMRVTGDYSMLFHTGSHYNEAFNLCMVQHFRSILEPMTDWETGTVTVRETRKEYYKKGLVYISVVQDTDRGMPAFKKCVNTITALSSQSHSMFMAEFTGLLTDDELSAFAAGDDVVISALEILERKVK
jgi:hypothetical protein